MRSPLIIGCTGQVSEALFEELEGRATCTTRLGDGVAVPVDLAHLTQRRAHALLSAAQPSHVFLSAGMTWVDGCERDEEAAIQVNAKAPAMLARAAADAGIPLVFFSSDYVFDGESGPYDETACPNPVNVYGRTKLAGEQGVLEASPMHLVLRTTVVWGPETKGKNFAYRAVETLRRGAPLQVASDQISTPTYNRDLARAAVGLAACGAEGVVHVAGRELFARDAFAVELARCIGVSTDGIEAQVTAAFGPATARRPLRAGLCSTRLETFLPEHHWHSVEEGMADWQAHPRGRRLHDA